MGLSWRQRAGSGSQEVRVSVAQWWKEWCPQRAAVATKQTTGVGSVEALPGRATAILSKIQWYRWRHVTQPGDIVSMLQVMKLRLACVGSPAALQNPILAPWNASNTNMGGASRRQKSKTRRSPSSPQIHQKYIYTWNCSYRTPTERWQKTSDLPKGKKLPTYLGRAKEKRKNRDKE